MKRRILSGTLGTALLLTLSACGGETLSANQTKAPASASDMEGEQYKGVVSDLKDAGFTKVDTKKIDDLITGWLTKDGEVEDVKINGSKDFESGDVFDKDAKVVVAYHTFPEKKEKDEEEPSDEAIPSDKPSPEPTPARSNKVINPQNNKEFAALMTIGDNCDPAIGKFVDANQGRKVAFNGSVIADPIAEDYLGQPWWTVTFAPGDAGVNSSKGAYFQMESIAESDIPLAAGAELAANTRVRLTATLEEFNEDQCLVKVAPVDITTR
ncbi:hypothetical protein GCM10011584_34240 [Nocardioides phosphati]|uniref:DUF4839 domain-containing protein n=1 Tax=Nocardioides phosphati TaxID=1867775 RepID=A0ABQ2NDP8_9ACTN|nr:DUF4839 domain-containing protein [Nocardioides phosphati]GGO94064.1 hypothetical protein GCM10011584_34240 [Nocardioides phosphati]